MLSGPCDLFSVLKCVYYRCNFVRSYRITEHAIIALLITVLYKIIFICCNIGGQFFTN